MTSLLNYLEASDSFIDKTIEKESSTNIYWKRKIPKFVNQLKAAGITNELAIAAAIQLFKIRRKPYWEVEEVIDVFKSNSDIIDDKYKKLLIGKSDLDDKEISKLAKEIAQSIQKNDSGKHKEVADILSHKKADSILAHELSDDQLNSFYIAVVNSTQELESLLDDFKTEHIFTFDPDKDKLFTNFMNNLTGHTPENNLLLKEMQLAIKELTDMLHDPSLTNKKSAIQNKIELLKSYNNEINKLSRKHVVWPEPDFAIKSIADFKKYFNDIKSQRKTYEKSMNIYKKKMNKEYNKLGD